jgi:hypothetical protein
MHSIEQGQDFHLARRVAAVVAPRWRLLASQRLEVGGLVVDSDKKTVEVGEGTEGEALLAALSFGLGFARLASKGRHPEFFGFGLGKWAGKEAELSVRLKTQCSLAEREAATWAGRLAASLWPHREVGTALRSYAWSRADWRRYFSLT